MKKLIIGIVAVVSLIGCVSATSHIIHLPNGRVGVRTTCHPDIAECYEEAGEVCTAGYDVVSSSMHWGGTIADLMPGPVPWYNVLVSCR